MSVLELKKEIAGERILLQVTGANIWLQTC